MEVKSYEIKHFEEIFQYLEFPCYFSLTITIPENSYMKQYDSVINFKNHESHCLYENIDQIKNDSLYSIRCLKKWIEDPLYPKKILNIHLSTQNL